MSSIISKKRKVIIIVLILIFIFAPISHRGVNRAEAIPFISDGFLAAIAASTAVDAGASVSQVLKEIADGIAWAAINFIIEGITRQTVNWINGSSDGAPKFVTDLPGFLKDIGDKTTGEFLLNELPLVCSPFRLDVELALRQRYIPERNYQCTLGNVFDNVTDFEEFLGGNFYKGGWDGWLELTQRNSPYQTISSINDTINAEIQGRQNIELAKLDWGQGFFGSETCPNEVYECSSSFEGGIVTETGCDAVGGIWKCVEPTRTNTPGSVVQAQLNKVLGNSTDRLIVADEISEIVGALLSKLVTSVLTKTSGLLGFDETEFPGEDMDSVFISFSATPPTVTYDTAPTLIWAAQNATSCTASDGWSGNKDTIGYETVDEQIFPTTYTITCKGNGVTSVKSIFVNIKGLHVPNEAPPGWIEGGGGDDDGGGGGGERIPPGASCVPFASNGGDYCDEDSDRDVNNILQGGATVELVVVTGTGGTWFLTPFDDMIANPPSGGWTNSLNLDGYPRCQAYGNFGNNLPFPTTMTFQDSDNGKIYSIPASSNGVYTLGVYGGSGASNEAWLCTDGGGGSSSGGKPNFNSAFFIDDIVNVSTNRTSLDFRTKLKMQRGGSAWWDSSGFHVRWEEVPGWTPITAGAPPFGQLHIVAYISSRGGWYDWNIEDLERNGENGGTDSVNIDSVGSAVNSPDSSFQLQSGDWFGLYIATYPGGLSVRSDILPVQY